MALYSGASRSNSSCDQFFRLWGQFLSIAVPFVTTDTKRSDGRDLTAFRFNQTTGSGRQIAPSRMTQFKSVCGCRACTPAGTCRSEERRVGKGGGSTGNARGRLYKKNKKTVKQKLTLHNQVK